MRDKNILKKSPRIIGMSTNYNSLDFLITCLFFNILAKDSQLNVHKQIIFFIFVFLHEIIKNANICYRRHTRRTTRT